MKYAEARRKKFIVRRALCDMEISRQNPIAHANAISVKDSGTTQVAINP